MKQIKMLTSIEGETFSAAHNAIIEIDDAIAAAWIAAGMAIEAPSLEISTSRIAELEKRVADATGARDGLAAENTDLRAQLANLSGAVKGAEKDRDTYKADLTAANKAARALQAQIVEAQRALDDAKAVAAAQADAAARELAAMTAQAQELGRQLEAAKAATAPAA